MDDRTKAIIEELRTEVERLKERIESLEQENRRLREELEKAQQQAARQADPFRREKRKKIPPDEQFPPGLMAPNCQSTGSAERIIISFLTARDV